jgi:carbamoyltransferase
MAAIAATDAAQPGRLHVTRTGDHVRAAAELLAAGAVVGWFDGASEIGPRALGHRSILADPRSSTVRDHLNAHVKHREAFRPFAPAVLNEYADAWFGLVNSPFMLRACSVLRPEVPAITHVDGTSRIQTVVRADNPAFYALIDQFRQLTGVPLLLNTSLNTKGLPIDETPADALATFLDAGLDHLVFPGVIVGRNPGAGRAP